MQRKLSTRWPAHRVCVVICAVIALTRLVSAADDVTVLSGLEITPAAFEPANGEETTISFRSRAPGQAIVRLFGPDWQQVREIGVDTIDAGESVRVTWDGLDDFGEAAPAEAYFPVVEFADHEGRIATLDPTRATRIGPVILEGLHYHRDTGAVMYQLSEPARVTLHAGIDDGGPLLRTVLADVPRLAGEHRELWDGADDTGAVDIAAQEGFRLFADGVGMWAPSVIIRNRDAEPYAVYRQRVASRLVLPTPKLETFGGTPAALPRPHDITPEPRFTVSVAGPPGADGLPQVSGRVRVQVALDERVRIPVLERRFEIVLFVDMAFLTEVEEGQSPATVVWDSAQVPDGEYLLTVNVATLPGQMSSASVRVRTKNEP